MARRLVCICEGGGKYPLIVLAGQWTHFNSFQHISVSQSWQVKGRLYGVRVYSAWWVLVAIRQLDAELERQRGDVFWMVRITIGMRVNLISLVPIIVSELITCDMMECIIMQSIVLTCYTKFEMNSSFPTLVNRTLILLCITFPKK